MGTSVYSLPMIYKAVHSTPFTTAALLDNHHTLLPVLPDKCYLSLRGTFIISLVGEVGFEPTKCLIYLGYRNSTPELPAGPFNHLGTLTI